MWREPCHGQLISGTRTAGQYNAALWAAVSWSTIAAMTTTFRGRSRLLIVTVIVLVGIAPMALAQSHSVFVPPSLAVLSYFEGDVRVDAEEAALGQTIPYGSLVQCAADSYAEITMGTGNVMRIRENSVIVVEVTRAARRVELRAGTFAAVLNNLSSDAFGDTPGFFLRTRGAVAGVRGTSFFASVESPNSTYICTCNGSLSLNHESFPAFSTNYYHHGARRFVTAPDGSVTVEVAPLLYHTDEQMEELAARIGATIPWSDSY